MCHLYACVCVSVCVCVSELWFNAHTHAHTHIPNQFVIDFAINAALLCDAMSKAI